MNNLYLIKRCTRLIFVCVTLCKSMYAYQCVLITHARTRAEGRMETRFSLDTVLSRIQSGVSNIPIRALRTRLTLSLNYMHVECLVCFSSAIIIGEIEEVGNCLVKI